MSGRPRHRRGVLPRASEAAWQQQVVSLARLYGWRVYHAPAGGKDGRVDREQIGSGFPDLVLVRPPELLFAELKPDTVKRRPGTLDAEVASRPAWLQYVDVTVEQAGWLEALAIVGDRIAAHVGRLEDLGYWDEATPAVEAHVWRPADLEVVHNRLSRGRQQLPPAG